MRQSNSDASFWTRITKTRLNVLTIERELSLENIVDNKITDGDTLTQTRRQFTKVAVLMGVTLVLVASLAACVPDDAVVSETPQPDPNLPAGGTVHNLTIPPELEQYREEIADIFNTRLYAIGITSGVGMSFYLKIENNIIVGSAVDDATGKKEEVIIGLVQNDGSIVFIKRK
jgi:hypothetical protein